MLWNFPSEKSGVLWQSLQPALPTNSSAPVFAASGIAVEESPWPACRSAAQASNGAGPEHQRLLVGGDRLGEVDQHPRDGVLVLRVHAIEGVAERLAGQARLTARRLPGLALQRKAREAAGRRRPRPSR